MVRLAARLALLAVLVNGCVSGEDLPSGRIIERVVCSGNERQSYALYLPPAYSPERAWPILYCLDPAARGRLAVERFARAAADAGWIVAGSNVSRNGAVEASREAIEWLVRDTHDRFRIDDSRVFAAGFSGGARLALAWATGGGIAGVIASGAAFGTTTGVEKAKFRVFATAGVDDFNYDEVYAMCLELSRRGVPQRFVEFPGAHDWLPEPLAAGALEFLSGSVAAGPPPPASVIQTKAAQRYASVMAQIGGGEDARDIVRSLRTDAQLPEDGSARRAARRALAATFIDCVDRASDLLAAKKYADAATQLNVAVAAQPENPEAQYALAVAEAGAGRAKQAVSALERAIATGFRERERIERQPAFDRVRNSPTFVKAIAALSK
jgi:predicted esterase